MTTEPEIAATTSKVRSLLWSARSKKAKVGLLAGLVVAAIAASACSGTTAEPDTAIESTPAPVAEAPADIEPQASEPQETTATTEVVVIEGADSSKDAIAQWYDSIAQFDLPGMWAIIDAPLKSNVSRSAWDSCIAAQFEDLSSIDSLEIDYDEAEMYSEDGAMFSTGLATIKAEGEEITQPQTFEVIEREGGWFLIDQVTSNNEQGCLETSSSADNTQAVEIVDSGFGQSEDVVYGVVVVTANNKAAVGEFVTVSVNFLDADGQILATEEQVESFNWVGQELVLPVWLLLDDPAATVAAIDPSVSISNYGAKSAEAPLPVLEATEINKNRYGSYVPSFSFMNETGTDLDNLRVGVVCYDASDSIIGGGSMYPGLAPAGKSIRLDADSLTVTGIPASCKAFMNYS